MGVELPAPIESVAQERFRFGVLDSPTTEVLGEVRQVVFDGAAGVLVLDGVGNRIIRLDGDGKVVGLLDREGEGPGELVSPVAIAALPPERLVVLDFQRGLMQLFNLADLETEVDRFGLGFRPSDACALEGRLYVLGILDDRAVHEIEPESGEIVRSFESSRLPDPGEDGDPVAMTLFAESGGGTLICSASGSRILHAPSDLGWIRAFRPDGQLEWETELAGFVEPVRVPSGAGVRFDLDPDMGYANSIIGVTELPAGAMAVYVRYSYGRASGRDPWVEAVFLQAESGEEIGRAEDRELIALSNQEAAVTVTSEPFPRLTLWDW